MPPPGFLIYLRPRVTLNFDLLHPSCDTIGICRKRAFQVWLKYVGQFLRYLTERATCDLFRTGVTLPFDLLNTIVDHFMSLPGEPLMPIGIKIGSFVFKIHRVHKLVTDEQVENIMLVWSSRGINTG